MQVFIHRVFEVKVLFRSKVQERAPLTTLMGNVQDGGGVCLFHDRVHSR
jgi:hypothetical protein